MPAHSDDLLFQAAWPLGAPIRRYAPRDAYPDVEGGQALSGLEAVPTGAPTVWFPYRNVLMSDITYSTTTASRVPSGLCLK